MTEPTCKRCGRTGVHTCSLKEPDQTMWVCGGCDRNFTNIKHHKCRVMPVQLVPYIPISLHESRVQALQDKLKKVEDILYDIYNKGCSGNKHGTYYNQQALMAKDAISILKEGE